MSTLALDLRYALRAVVKRPATSAVIIITLALGLGANAAVFAIIDALVLHPFNFARMDRLAVVAQTAPDNPAGTHESVAPGQLPRLEEASRHLRAAGCLRVVGRQSHRR